MLLNPWTARAGNAVFLYATVRTAVSIVKGVDAVTVVTVLLFAVGVVLMAAPLIRSRLGQTNEQALKDKLGRELHVGHELLERDADMDAAFRWGQRVTGLIAAGLGNGEAHRFGTNPSALAPEPEGPNQGARHYIRCRIDRLDTLLGRLDGLTVRDGFDVTPPPRRTSPSSRRDIRRAGEIYLPPRDGEAPAPALDFCEPQVSDGKTFAGFLTGGWTGYVVVFHVANEGGETARAMWATMRVTSLDGTTVFHEESARWPSDTPEPKGGVKVPTHIDIPGNGQPHAIDSIVQAVGEFDVCWIVTNEGLRNEGVRQERWAVRARDFIVEMTVRGENVPARTQRVRVHLDFPAPTIEVVE